MGLTSPDLGATTEKREKEGRKETHEKGRGRVKLPGSFNDYTTMIGKTGEESINIGGPRVSRTRRAGSGGR